MVAEAAIGEQGCLSNSLQRRTQTVFATQAAVCDVDSTLNGKRSDNVFQNLFE